MTEESLSYRSAGVDIDAGNRLVDLIKPICAKTRRPEVLAGLGGFGALFEIPLDRYRKPVLVSGTDGVGTKLKLAIELDIHDTIGIDLVAMCVNDIVVLGAEPLFFLDYYATGKLNTDAAAAVVHGIGKGCELSGASLIGGETAEMPGMYTGEDYDLAGFCVGIVDKDRIIDGSQVQVGDRILGLASAGVHANGFSLVRKILEHGSHSLNQSFGQSTLGEALLAPTRIYVKPLLAQMQLNRIHAAAHITGGGLLENIPRVLPSHTRAVIDAAAWEMPELFRWLQAEGNVAQEEMYRTFNCGIGMALVVSEKNLDDVKTGLITAGETVVELGKIESHDAEQPEVVIQNP